MPVALDATAHPTGAPVAATAQCDASGTTIVSAAFSTGGNPRLIVALVATDGDIASFPVTVSGASLTWTQRVSKISTAFLNKTGVSIWTAWAASNLTSQSITCTFNVTGPSRSAQLWVWALSVGVASEAAALGATATAMSDNSTSTTIQVGVTASRGGSWVFGVFNNSLTSTGMTANSGTSSFDGTATCSIDGDNFAMGRAKSGGNVVNTVEGSTYTIGATDSSTIWYAGAIEILGSPPMRSDFFGPSGLYCIY